jgi:hypothetical protein
MTNKEMIEYFEKRKKDADKKGSDKTSKIDGYPYFYSGKMNAYDEIIEILKENEK